MKAERMAKWLVAGFAGIEAVFLTWFVTASLLSESMGERYCRASAFQVMVETRQASPQTT